MFRKSVRILLAAGLVGIGWAIGQSQAPLAAQSPAPAQADAAALSAGSEFELLVSTADGETAVTCVRGCWLTWAPTALPGGGRPVDVHKPGPYVQGAISPNGCVAPDWQPHNCRILGWRK